MLFKKRAQEFPVTLESTYVPDDEAEGVALRLMPHWFVRKEGGRTVQDGWRLLTGAIRGGRFSFSFRFIATEDLSPTDLVRVEFPEFGCVRTFPLNAMVGQWDAFVVQGHLDLKPSLPHLFDGKVEKLS